MASINLKINWGLFSDRPDTRQRVYRLLNGNPFTLSIFSTFASGDGFRKYAFSKLFCGSKSEGCRRRCSESFRNGGYCQSASKIKSLCGQRYGKSIAIANSASSAGNGDGKRNRWGDGTVVLCSSGCPDTGCWQYSSSFSLQGCQYPRFYDRLQGGTLYRHRLV